MKASSQRLRTQSALEDLPFYLVRAALSFRKFNDETLRAVGLASQAPGLATVLHALHEQDDCLIGDLIARTRLANGTVTGLLDRLERDRCIQRVQHADDRRSWRIQLTAKGRTLCKHLHRRHRLVMQMFAHALTPRETTALKRMLERIIREMAAYNRKT